MANVQKKMKTKDDMMKKQQDDYNNIRQKLAAMTKKDGGSYLVRDFTDEIYQANPDPSMFVDSHNS